MDTSDTICRDIDACRALWERWSPRKSLFDLWEYRAPFYDVYGYEPAFVTLGNRGMLPLWFHPEQRTYLWFGDIGDEFNWQEDCTFWVRDPADAGALLAAAPRPLRLTSLTQVAAEMIEGDSRVRPMNPKCVLPLAGIGSVDAYLETLPKKLRQNLRRDRKKTEEEGIEILRDRFEDFDALIRMNTAAFADSPFRDGRLVRVFDALIGKGKSPSSPVRVHLLSAHNGDTVVAADLIVRVGDVAYPMLCGSDTSAIPGIGNAMQLMDIAYAVEEGVSTLDFGEAEPGSKKTELFGTVPQYRYEVR